MNTARSKLNRSRLNEFRRFCWVRSLLIFGVLAFLAVGALASAATTSATASKTAKTWKDFNGKSLIVLKGGDDCAAGGFTLVEKAGRRELTLGPAIHLEQETQKSVTVTSETVPGSCHYETEVTGDARTITSTTVATSCPDLPNDTVIETLTINASGGIDYSIRRKELGKPDLVTSCVFKMGKLKN